MEFSKNLMDFSDCVLVEIFKFLDSTDFYNLSRVNTRLGTLMLDCLLWKNIEARSGRVDQEKNDFCLKRLNQYSRTFCIRGNFTNSPFEKLTENLKILALEDQYLDGKKVTLNNFPKSLEELSFRNSRILNSLEFFRRTSDQMVNLKVLLLDGCEYLNCSVVMSLSKYGNLRILSFYKCAIGNSIPYFSIAAWHGFKQMEILDVRLSGLGSSFLRSMIRCPRLHSLYFQNMDTSYVWDFKKYREETQPQSGKHEEEEDFRMTELNEESLISDRDMLELKRLVGEELDVPGKERIESYLYRDPYGACRCSGKGTEVGEASDVDAVLLKRRYPVREFRHRNHDDDRGDDKTQKKRRRPPFDVWCQLVKGDSPAPSSFNKRKFETDDDAVAASSSGVELPKSKKRRNTDASSSCQSRIARGVQKFCCCTDRDEGAGAKSGVASSDDDSDDDVSSCDEDGAAAVITVNFVRDNAVRNLNFGFNGFEIVNLGAEAGPASTSALRRLSFRGHSTITDAALPNLERLGLELLDVTHTSVTAHGLEAFQRSNPQCRILHRTFCVCKPLYHE